MQIENTPSAVAHIVSETETLRLEADVNIYNGKASEINNGRITRHNDEHPDIAADFSSFPGSNNITFYGQPDTEAQTRLITAINLYCASIRAATFTLTFA
ncbi:MAG: hypothetical protein HDT09_04120 [Bacteroidales bacterium]|nr:hypothetical protein [Bacteroidales bacterium]